MLIYLYTLHCTTDYSCIDINNYEYYTQFKKCHNRATKGSATYNKNVKQVKKRQTGIPTVTNSASQN